MPARASPRASSSSVARAFTRSSPLVQNYGVSEAVAKHLVHAYGSAAFAVCELAKPTGRTLSTMGVPTDGGAHVGKLIAPDYPYIEAEVLYACRHEMAVTVKDMLTTRMRLAYLNSEAAKQAIPRVANIMASELGWSRSERDRQVKQAQQYIGDFGGPVADKTTRSSRRPRTRTCTKSSSPSIRTARATSTRQSSRRPPRALAPFKSKEEMKAKFMAIAPGHTRITEAQFIEWWNGKNSKKVKDRLNRTLTLTAVSEVAIDKTLGAPDDKDDVGKALFGDEK